MLERQNLSIASHEEVVVCRDEEAGLRAIIAIHDTALGPAVGGTRMLPYSSEEEALADVLRLSHAMTYKAAAAGLDFGGGKAVIIGDGERPKPEALLLAFGRALESLQGRFLTGEDVGTTAEDMRVASRETGYVIYPHPEIDPDWETSFLTALGVLRGIQACVREVYGEDSLAGRRILIQGMGKVGERLARMLRKEGALLTISDIDPEKVRALAPQLGAGVVDPRHVFDADVDVFCPCALGGILDDGTIARLKCRIVAGAANNQLADETHGEKLHARGILYAPDYVINAGGLISALYEMGLSGREDVIARTDRIHGRILEICERGRTEGIPASTAAGLLAEERIERARERRRQAQPA
jgi:leucine dehydrogenase